MGEDVFKSELTLGGKTISVEVGKVAKQASGAALISCEGTTILMTAVASKEPREGVDFFPLTVDVEEKMYAAGKIPGGFFRREGRPSEKSILTARLIDRPIRPCFPDGFRNEVQVIATILSVDQVNPPDILALNGASLALFISDIPFQGPVGAVRIGRISGEWVINPTYQELEFSELDIVVAGREYYEDGERKIGLLMVEAGAKEVPEEVVVNAFEEASKSIAQIIDFQKKVAKKVGKPKMETELYKIDSEIEAKVRKLATGEIKKAVRIKDKKEREEKLEQIRKDIIEKLLPEYGERLEVVVFQEEEEILGEVRFPTLGPEADIKEVLKEIEKEEMRRMIVEENRRADGRSSEKIRPISVEVGVLPRTHGSALFTRGQTQVLTVATLGTTSEEQILDTLETEESKRYMHHYNFPPYCTGETRPLRGPRRREIGHGALAERALIPVIPSEKEFPYTIRLVSEVLESNGSTSMASVCGSTLALMDAGVPIKAPVAGIAMGLIKEKEKVAILTDILGMEDALGDMDFKVAGTEKGITALQMDIKIEGLTIDIIERALQQAKEARMFILKKMLSVIDKPREKLSPYAPRIYTLSVSPDKIGDIIGPGGKRIRSIIDETGVTIDIEQDGTVFIASKDEMSAEKAKEIIESIVRDVKVGEKFLGTVTRVADFGAFVEILPGKEGLVHVSKLTTRRLKSAKESVKPGDKLLVEVLEIDNLGRINLASVEYLEAVKQRKSHDRR
jgi:polyribonucleotide nucleotidyltransferase